MNSRGGAERWPFTVMTMPVGPACNLGCDYCYYLEKTELYPETTDFGMTEETLETYVEQYIDAFPGNRVTFSWQGGEPTLRGLDFFREVVRLQDEYAPPGVHVENTLQTNGTRLDDEWCAFLAAEDFLVGVSIDGPRELHDAFRTTRTGRGSFEAVVRGIECLRTHGVDHNVLCVVNSRNSQYPLEVYRFLRDLDIEWIQFIPLVEPTDGTVAPNAAEAIDLPDPTDPPEYDWVRDRLPGTAYASREYKQVVESAREASVSGRSVDPVAYGEFLCAIFDEWIRNDIGSVSVRTFEHVMQTAVGQGPNLCVFAERCGDQLALEHNGDVYSCDHFVDSGYHLGNLHETPLGELARSRQQQSFGRFKRQGLSDHCRDCEVRDVCNGGCPRNWLIEAPDGTFGHNYLCAGYRRFFNYVRPYMDLLQRGLERGLPITRIRDQVQALDARYGDP